MSMNKHTMRPTALALAISVIASSLPLQAGAQTGQVNRRAPAVRPSTPVTLNFVNTDIEAVTRAMSAAMGKPILVDPRVKGTMTLTAEQPVPVQEAYLSYLATLRGMGFAMVEANGLLKLVPEAEAKLQTGNVTVAGEGRARGDQVVTQIFKLSHENANNLVAVLRPLITPNNTINANPGNNSLVITDYADNLQRLSRIVSALDQPSNTDIEVIPLRNAVASDIVQLVQRLSEGGGSTPGIAAAQGAAGGSGNVMADPRSNSLIVRASNPAKLMQLRAMIAKLDQPGIDAATGNIRVIYLKNSDAVRLATVLRAAFTNASASGSGSGQGGSGGGTGNFASAQTGSGGNSGSGFAGNSSSFGGNNSSSGSGSSGSSGGSASTQVSQTAQVNTGGFVQADPATNSLIITAPEPMYRQIRAVVEQLDTRRAQVYVEALVVKVDASKLGEFGVQFTQLFGNKGDSTVSGFGTNFGTGYSNILNLSAATATGTTGVGTALASGQVPAGLNLGFLKKIGSVYTLGAVANALGQIAGTNVLSTPSLVVQDNEEADLLIGSNVPVLTGNTTTTSGSTTSPFQTFERRDVGLRLKVRTQVGENGTVRLKVYQENSSVVATVNSATQGPTFDKSAVETSVTLEDGQVLVLGGLLKDEYTDSEDKVPGLGDIPLLGNLFKSQSRKRVKSNLMIFLRPVVLRTPENAAALSMDRYDAIRAYQQDAQPKSNLVLPDTGAPLLPEKPASAPGVLTPNQLPLPVNPAASSPAGAAPGSVPTR